MSMRTMQRLATVLALAFTCGTSRLAPTRFATQIRAATPPADQILTEPDEGVRPLIHMLNQAQRSIFVETYILTDQLVLHALERAAAQRVDVRVMLEPHALGMGRQPVKEAMLLRAAGVDVRWTSKSFPLTHAKLCVLDDKLAIVSTANLSRSAFSSNREFLMIDRRPSEVRDLSDLFRHDWDRLPFTRVLGRLVLSPLNARRSIEGLLRQARHTIDIYAEELVDAQVERMLARAQGKGVRVRVLLPPGSTTSAQAELMRSGVKICRPRSPYIHAKAVVSDGVTAYIGSTNLSAQSLDRNREVGLVETGLPVKLIEHEFTRDWCHSPNR